MPNTAMESTSCPVEKSSEGHQASAESASNAYCKDAPTDFAKGANTADQHLNQATISSDSIDFGPPDGGKKQDIIDRDKTYGATPEGGKSVTNLDGSGRSTEYGAGDSRKETSWDKDGNRYSQTFDKNGRMTEAETREKSGAVSKYRYDENGTNHYSHRNKDGKLVEESMFRKDGSGEAREYEGEKLRKSTSRDGEGTRRTESYDEDGRLTEAETKNDSGEKYTYKYDKSGTYFSHKDEKGNVIEESLSRPDGSGEQRRYEGDKLRSSISLGKDKNRADDPNARRHEGATPANGVAMPRYK